MTRAHSSRRACLLGLGAAAVALLLGSLMAPAEAAPIHVRGTIAAIDGSMLTVKTYDGRSVALDLAADWKLTGVVKGTMDDIKQGTFIGTASLPAEGDTGKAIEVVVFPESMRGAGEGHYPWDLKPSSMMTNATVNHSVEGVDGRTVTLDYKGGEKKVVIAPATPIVIIGPTDKADLKPGEHVFLAGEPDGDTKMKGGFLVVGKDGITPPM
jgi:hypothetical protein